MTGFLLASEDPGAIRAHLLKSGHPAHLVCDETCRFVIEGYPESGNVLVADLLHVLNPRLKFAHHTHDPLNLRLGALLKLPRVVLLRRPFDAICAFAATQAGLASVGECARRYVDFHRAVAAMDDVIVAEYAMVAEDINAIVARLNERLSGGRLAFSADVPADVERAHQRLLKRLADRSRTPPTPEERAEAEARVADQVRAILSYDEEAENLYALVLSRGG